MGILSATNMSNKIYDAIIIGGGISGGIMAKQLTKSGFNVLMIESGTDTSYRDYKKSINNFYVNSIKVPNSPYPFNTNSPQPDVLDVHSNRQGTGYFIQKGSSPFRSDYTRTLGGTTLHWLGTCLRMMPEDFKMNKKFGIGLDWPFDYEKLRPYYNMAEEEIGVSAEVEDQKELARLMGIKEDMFEKGYVYPMHSIPQSYLDEYIKKGLKEACIDYEGYNYPIRVTSTPQGRNGIPNKKYASNKGYKTKGSISSKNQGHRCQGYSNCIPICPSFAKYNALKTIDDALVTGKLDVVTQAVANEIIITDNGRVSAIKYKTYSDPNSTSYNVGYAKGKIFILAAHVVENVKILHNSKIGGDKVGRYLMDHPFMLTLGLANKPLGTFRGPSSTSGIETLRCGPFRQKRSAFRIEISNWGWNWIKGDPMNLLNDLVYSNNVFGKKLRKSSFDISQRQVTLGFMLEQPAEFNNYIFIDPLQVDAIGNPRPIINYRISNYIKTGMEEAVRTSNYIFNKLGVEDHTKFSPNDPGYVEHKGNGYVYYGAGHFAGGHVMGTSPSNSVVDPQQCVWGHENLYMIGCGNMPSVGTANPTLTAAALTFMASENIIKKLSKF